MKNQNVLPSGPVKKMESLVMVHSLIPYGIRYLIVCGFLLTRNRGPDISYWVKKMKNQEKELEAWSLKEIWQWVEILIRRLSEFLWDKSGFWSLRVMFYTKLQHRKLRITIGFYHLIERPVRRKLRWYEMNLNPIDHPHFLICSLLWKSICLLFTPSVALTLMATSECIRGIYHHVESPRSDQRMK